MAVTLKLIRGTGRDIVARCPGGVRYAPFVALIATRLHVLDPAKFQKIVG